MESAKGGWLVISLRLEMEGVKGGAWVGAVVCVVAPSSAAGEEI